MARDYKHHGRKRTYGNNKPSPQLAAWRWALITALIIAFAVGLYALKVGYDQSAPVVSPPLAKTEVPAKPVEREVKPVRPEFEFFTILSEKEVVVPEQEIKARIREEKQRAKPETKKSSVSYTIQAGSFRDPARAESLKAQLALLGMESHIEKAKIGEMFWHRIKIGPYHQARQVGLIMDRLKDNGIQAKVTESSG